MSATPTPVKKEQKEIKMMTKNKDMKTIDTPNITNAPTQENAPTREVKEDKKDLNKENITTLSRKKHCKVCRRKLVLDYFTCRCSTVGDVSNMDKQELKKSNIFFCSVHRYPQEHQCTFDIKKLHKDKLEKINPKV